jgi:hypothetical protein
MIVVYINFPCQVARVTFHRQLISMYWTSTSLFFCHPSKELLNGNKMQLFESFVGIFMCLAYRRSQKKFKLADSVQVYNGRPFFLLAIWLIIC